MASQLPLPENLARHMVGIMGPLVVVVLVRAICFYSLSASCPFPFPPAAASLAMACPPVLCWMCCGEAF